MPRLLIHFARFGPYHNARLSSAIDQLLQRGWEVTGLEMAGSDSTYKWDRLQSDEFRQQKVTVFPGRIHEEITTAECREVLYPILDRLNPHAMAIAGWGSTDARACLDWCKKHGTKTIVMSETREVDSHRVWWKERLKGRLIRQFDGALVGGKSHREYLVKLGIPHERIELGYNLVNNDFFEHESQRFKDQKIKQSIRPYFLASNRFIGRKNLTRLIQGFAESLNESPEIAGWDLCLLGDGPLKTELFEKCDQLELPVSERAPWERSRQVKPSVYFPGFRQIGELPRFYAHAGCFVHPALEEPWGLVINEAMACRLPILSGRNVGAAEELVDDGVNGWCFDSENVTSIAECLGKVARLSEDQRAAMGTVSAQILEERCPTSAFGIGLAEILRGLCPQAL